MTKEHETVINQSNDEDSDGVSQLWKTKAERLADFVSGWVGYTDDMIVVIRP